MLSHVITFTKMTAVIILPLGQPFFYKICVSPLIRISWDNPIEKHAVIVQHHNLDITYTSISIFYYPTSIHLFILNRIHPGSWILHTIMLTRPYFYNSKDTYVYLDNRWIFSWIRKKDSKNDFPFLYFQRLGKLFILIGNFFPVFIIIIMPVRFPYENWISVKLYELEWGYWRRILGTRKKSFFFYLNKWIYLLYVSISNQEYCIKMI